MGQALPALPGAGWTTAVTEQERLTLAMARRSTGGDARVHRGRKTREEVKDCAETWESTMRLHGQVSAPSGSLDGSFALTLEF